MDTDGERSISLNRNILECKCGKLTKAGAGDEGLNRNILECKFDFCRNDGKGAYSLNRNILECKFIIREVLHFLLYVLIETYWNVNQVIGQTMPHGQAS